MRFAALVAAGLFAATACGRDSDYGAKVVGQCTTISVSTNLSNDADGAEIATGLKDAPCNGPFG